MLIDMHAHSSGISTCCQIPYDKVIDTAKGNGMDGIVLTNHYQKNYVKDGDYAAFAQRYVDEYKLAKAYGDSIGYPVFFGIEVTTERYPGVHLLLYGVKPEFLTAHPMIFDYTQEEIYRLVQEQGGAVIQAPPMRKNVDRLLDFAYLDGIEISCHPLYEGTHLEELTAIAAEKGVILTCGGDFHADTHRPHCGVYLPEELDTIEKIAAYLKTAESVDLCVQETREMISHDVHFCRGRIGGAGCAQR
jgi:hypothetical protein